MKLDKEEIVELQIAIDKGREEIIKIEAVRDEEIAAVRSDHEIALIPLREKLATDEQLRKDKLLVLK